MRNIIVHALLVFTFLGGIALGNWIGYDRGWKTGYEFRKEEVQKTFDRLFPRLRR